MAAAVVVRAAPGRTSGAKALLVGGGAGTRADRNDVASGSRAGMRTTHLPDQPCDRLHQQMRLGDRIAAALQLDPRRLPRPPSTSRTVHHADRHVRHRRGQNADAVCGPAPTDAGDDRACSAGDLRPSRLRTTSELVGGHTASNTRVDDLRV